MYANLVAPDGLVSCFSCFAHASLPFFWRFFLSTATRIVATTQQIEIGEVAVLTIAITKGDHITLGHFSVGLLPDVAVFQYATAFDAKIDVPVTMYALGADVTLIVRSVSCLESGATAALDTLFAHELLDALALVVRYVTFGKLVSLCALGRCYQVSPLCKELGAFLQS